MKPVIRRGFAELEHGQMHYRTAGQGDPLVLVHASPGSSKQLVSLIGELAAEFLVFSPDTPGNGDSPPLPVDGPEIADLARAYLGFLDAMGLDRVRLYGSHTGAAIAAELAALAPDRISQLVLNGVQVLTPAERAEVLAHYAHPFTPDLDGAYLIRAFQFCRDQYLFYPWYERTIEAQRVGGLPTPGDLHNWVVEVLKGAETYHYNYHASFRWYAPDRMKLIECPTLVVAAENDPLFDMTEAVTSELSDGRFVVLPRLDAPNFVGERTAVITAFYNSKI